MSPTSYQAPVVKASRYRNERQERSDRRKADRKGSGKNNEDVLQSKRMFDLLLSFVILYPPAFEESVPSPGIKFRLHFLSICFSVSHIKAFMASPPLTLPSVGVNPKPEPISSFDQNQDLLMRSPKEARGWIRPKRWPCF